MVKKIKCADCCFAIIDHKASDYTQKGCSKCESHKNCKFEKTDDICPVQKLKWAAYQCGNHDSEYHKALLNVTPNGDRQEHITWSGCEDGETKLSSAGRCSL